jgi:hypothetical protein
MSANCPCALNQPNVSTGTCMPEIVIDNIVKVEGINISNQDTIHEKIEKLSNKLECGEKNKELCILSKSNIDNSVKMKIDQKYFKPYAGSLLEDYWLNNSEIDSCLRQFQLKFKNFAYSYIHMSDLVMFPPENKEVVPHPIYPVTQIDFGSEFKKQDKLKTEEPLKYYGVIFNTDTSSGSGIHWFCIFIAYDDVKDQYTIELFNSSGENIKSDEFNRFWEKTALDISKKTGKKCTFEKVSNIQHQDEKTGSCGAYSLFYIFARLNGHPASEFNNKKRIVTDDEMTKFRNFLFRNEYSI